MVLKAFTELTDPPLEVTYDGSKVYRIFPVTIEAGAVLTDAQVNPDDYKDRPSGWMASLVLGPLWDELKADGVPLIFADRVYLTALAEWQAGRGYAEHIWEQGVDPKVVATFLETRKAAETPKPKRASGRSTRTGGAGTTR